MGELKIQTIIFDKNVFTTRTLVRRWIINNGFKLLKYKKQPIDSKENTWRVRQRDPKYFNKFSFRTKKIRKGINIVVGKIK